MRLLLKKTIIFTGILVLGGCNQNKDRPIFIISMEVKVKEDDTFQLFYTTTEEEKFSPDHFKKTAIHGKNRFQTVQYELPLQSVPEKLRLDIGENQLETLIKIKFIEIQYKQDTLKIKGAAIHRFFRSNQYIEKKGTNLFLRRKVNGNYDPYFVATPLFWKKIELEF